jgi:hypothetical protein
MWVFLVGGELGLVGWLTLGFTLDIFTWRLHFVYFSFTFFHFGAFTLELSPVPFTYTNTPHIPT